MVEGVEQLKIIQVCQRYYPDIGGIEKHVTELSEALVKKGNDVEVVCTYSSHKLPDREIINGVKITRFWAFAPSEAYFFSPSMYFYLKGQDCDVMHAHNYNAFPALFAAFSVKKKFIFTPHTFGFSKTFLRNILHRLYRPFGEHIFRRSNTIISTAQFERNWLKETFRIQDSKLIYIPLPINILDSKPHKKPDDNNVKIAYFGRLSQEKNIKVLISAFKIIKQRYKNSVLFIAGDGPLRKDLDELGKSTEDVRFLGRLSEKDLNRFLEDIDIFVLPSRFEVSPRSVIEAMSKGIPVVSTPVGELPQVFEHGKHCMFVKIDDPIDTAEKIMLLIENKEIAEKIAAAGRDLVEEKYDLNRVILEYLRIYGAIFSPR